MKIGAAPPSSVPAAERGAELDDQLHVVADAAEVDDRVVGVGVHVDVRRAGQVEAQRAGLLGLDPSRPA